MKRVLIAAAALAASAAAAPAFAQDATGWYGNLGYSNNDVEGVNLGEVTGRLGYRMHPNFAVEGEVGFGVNDEDVFPGTTAKLDNQAGIYAVGLLPVSPNLDVFARVGYGRAEVSVDGPGFTGSGDGDGVRYGAGAQWMWDGANGLRGDWTRHDYGDNGNADVWSISYVRKF
jgi:hypothetical protein